MRIGVSPHPLGPGVPDEFGPVLPSARLAEELGFDHVIAAGHILGGAAGLTMDPLVTLAAIAGATTRIRLVTSVVVLPLYNPVALANQAASLDVLSAGRFTLGIGTGWDTAEYDAAGIPFGERGPRTDEHLQVLKALWSGSATDFDGKFTSFRQASTGIAPATPGGPEIWVGGHSRSALRRTALFGDAWHGVGVDAAGTRQIRDQLDALAQDAGRDGAGIPLTSGQFLVPPGIPQVRPAPVRLLGGATPTADSVIEELRDLETAGLSGVSLWMPIAPQQMAEALHWLAREVLPHVG